MSPEDNLIYESWKAKNLNASMKLYFDVGLGDGVKPPAALDQNMIRGWLYNTQKRADLVVDTGEECWIVEFRFEASSNAIGRLLMYRKLYLQDPIFKYPLKLILVSNRYDNDLAGLAQDTKIESYGVISDQ